jgi:sialate O-acetylesterase
VLKQALGCPIGLVQTSLGGSPLSAWNPTEPGDHGLYANMLRCIERVGGRVRGVLWYQGESDTGPQQAPTYEQRFIAAVRAWREALHDPDLAVITVQLNRVYQPPNEEADRGWSQVREAQRQVPEKLDGVAVVPAFDLPLADGIHTSAAGNLLLGERMARAALGETYGRPINCLAPSLTSAKSLDGGAAVELAFGPVTSRIECIDPTANAFRVEDDEGVVPIASVTYWGNNRVRLVLGRPLHGSAFVHGGYGANPPLVPMDVERFLPILGFYGAKVE